MTAGTIVLAVSSVVILAGSATELHDVAHRRREHVSRKEAVEGLLSFRPAATLAWVGLAAGTVLLPALFRTSTLPLGDVALIVFVLGFAAERASYLLARTTSPDSRRRFAQMGLVTAGVAVGGLAIGLTA